MKKFIINPTNIEREDLTMISPNSLLKKIVEKVLMQKEDGFKETVVRPEHIGRFINNVQPKLIASNLYAGKVLKSFHEAFDFFYDLGTRIYEDKYWIKKAVSNEVYLSNDNNAMFGIKSDDEDLIKALVLELSDYSLVITHLPSSQTKESV